MENTEKHEFKLTMTTDVIITEEDIADIMNSAMYGISYWADVAGCIGEMLGEDICEHVAMGGKIKIHLTEGPIEEGGTSYYQLDRDKILKGIRQYLNDPEDMLMNDIVFNNGVRAELETCDIDSAVADLIVQYGLFGEKVFA